MRTLLLGLLLHAVVYAPALAGEGLPERWAGVVAKARKFSSPAAQITFISEYFLGTPYRADTLGGGPGEAEELTVQMEAVDCFTLLDYVEALRRTVSGEPFREVLIGVRYRDGVVSWEARRHFFSDWTESPYIADVTRHVGRGDTQQAHKRLNLKPDGRLLLDGVPVSERSIDFIPTGAIDAAVLERLQEGDYLGIYSAEPWLDVSHVGILVYRDGRLFYRHASSRPEASAVIDVPLKEYLAGKPGVVVLRPGAP